MPRTTVYIRNDDWEKWKQVENKSDLISRALNPNKEAQMRVVKSAISLGEEIEKTKKSPLRNASNWCKEHGVEKSVCKGFKH